MKFLKKRSRNGHGSKQEQVVLELYDEKERTNKMGSSRREEPIEMKRIRNKSSAMRSIRIKSRVKNIYFLLGCSAVTFVLLQMMMHMIMFIGDNSVKGDAVNLIELDSEPNVNPDIKLLWSGEEIVRYESKKRHMIRTIELVVAYCSSSLEWVQQDDFLGKISMKGSATVKITIISKCDMDSHVPDFTKDARVSELSIIPVENVGGCDYAYSYFINRYAATHSLYEAGSSVILFIKDTPRTEDYFKRMPFHEKFRSIDEMVNIASRGGFGCGTKPDCDKSPYHSTNDLMKFTMEAYVRQTELNKGYHKAGEQSSADFNVHEYQNLEDFQKRALDWTYASEDHVYVCYGGSFAVPASRIVRLSRRPTEGRVLRDLENVLSRGTIGGTTVEEHYVERTWAGLLSHALTNDQTKIIEEISKGGDVNTIHDSVVGILSVRNHNNTCTKEQVKVLIHEQEKTDALRRKHKEQLRLAKAERKAGVAAAKAEREANVATKKIKREAREAKTKAENEVAKSRGFLKRYEPNKAQQIILFAGPHRSASTSMQRIAFILGSDKVYTQEKTKKQKGNWTWLSPPEVVPSTPKSFEFWLRSLRSNNLSENTEIMIYFNELRKRWRSGNSIIMGGEDLDSCVGVNATKSEDYLDNALSIMPPRYEKYTTVVINYRSPRIEQLKSLWKEVDYDLDGSVSRTFYDFLMDPNLSQRLHMIDALQMAAKFLERGLRVSLLDLSGLEKNKIELFQVVACEIMKEECNYRKKMPLALRNKSEIVEELKERANVRTTINEKMNVTQAQLDAIDLSLRTYDCNYKSIFLHKNFQVLQSHNFHKIMRDCFVGVPTATDRGGMHQSWIKILTSSTEELAEEKLAIAAQRQIGYSYEPALGQQIVLLAGPHKAGSTTAQNIALSLATLKKPTYHERWNWIAPPDLGRQGKKAFAYLPLAIRMEGIEGQNYKPREETVEIFRKEVSYHWQSGNNLIMGSEEIDHIAGADEFKAKALLDDILSILPSNYEKFTNVIVNYRAPKIKHLISVWKQVTQSHPVLHGQTFKDFILSDDEFELAVMDSMRLAKLFLDRGLKVTLLDLSGLKKDNIEMYKVMACEIMKEKCDPVTGIPLSLVNHPKMIKNIERDANTRKLRDQLGTGQAQLDSMDWALKMYDCSYKDVFKHDNFTVLHSNDFGKHMEECDALPAVNMKDTLASLKKIIGRTRSV